LNCGSLFKEECPEDCDRNFDENCPKWTPDDKRFKMTEGSEYEPRKVIEDWGLNFYRGIEDGINHAEKRGDNKMNTDKYNVNLETKTFDSVKNPPYYTEGRQYEPRKVIEDWGLNFYLGNVVKYISRAGRKDVKTQYEDLLKAYQYLEWELDRLRLLDDKEGPSK
jgi:hypothetical protein